MRLLIATTFVTLDGVMQAPGGPQEDPTGGFTYGGWTATYWDERMQDVGGAAMARPFDVLLGRKTYEIFAAHWPYVGDDDPMAVRLNQATKYVATRTLESADWVNTVILQGDAAAEVAKLKEGDGPEILIEGSSDLIQSLLPTGLIDQFRIWTFPVVVGPGKRLFGEGTAGAGLELVETSTSTTGVTMSTYRLAGDVPLGSFALEEPTDAEVRRRDSLES